MKTAVIVGAGHRALNYASYAEKYPGKFKIVGVAEPSAERRRIVCERFGIPAEHAFCSAEELAAVPKFADAAINGTMDRQHVPTTVPLLERGYDVLLEKPFAISPAEVKTLEDAVQRTGRRVMICHVLRYAPFYVALKKRVLDGEIGEIVDIQTA